MIKRKQSLPALFALSAALFYSVASLSASASELFWSDEDGAIWGSDIDGENIEQVFDGEGMGSFAPDIVVTDEYIYWSENAGTSAASIWRYPRDGGDEPAPFVEGFFTAPHFIAVDEENGYLYFSDYSEGIFRADLDAGGSPDQLVDGFQSWTPSGYTGVALEDEDTLFFLTVQGELYRVNDIRTSPWMGSAVSDFPGGDEVYGLVYDDATETVYYTDFRGNALRSYDLDTGDGEMLLSGVTNALGLKMSPSETHLVIAQRGIGVSGYQLDNGGFELLAEAPASHFGVAVTADPGDLEPPPPPEPGEILFHTDFEEEGQELDERPLTIGEGGAWSSFGEPAEGIAHVVEDTEEAFGRGTDNRFLRIETARHFSFLADFQPSDVITVSWDYIGRLHDDDGDRWLNANIRSGGSRAHITSPRPGQQVVRGGGNPSYGDNDVLIRMDTIVNNSDETITYDRPDGGTADLSPRMASLWLYHYSTGIWQQLQSEYVYVRELGDEDVGAILDNLYMQFDSGDPRSMDLDNIYVFDGAVPGEQFVEADVPEPDPPPFGGFVDADFTGIPTGEITRDNASDFVHGNLSDITFHRRYDSFDPDDEVDPEEEGFEPSPLLVAEDIEDQFGRGTDNRFLDTNQARGWRLLANNNFNEEILTFRMDLVGRAISGGRMTGRFFDQFGGVTHRVEIFSTGSSEGHFNPGGTWEYDSVQRFEWVLNNSNGEITYTAPNGSAKTLIAGGADMWVNGELQFSDSTYARSDGAVFGPIMNLRFEAFSTNKVDNDIDLVQVHPGVELVGVEPPVSDNFAAWQEDHFGEDAGEPFTGPGADASGDGIRNVVAYALDIDPLTPNRDHPNLPVRGTEVEGDDEYLSLSYIRPEGGREDVTYSVDAGGEPGEWESAQFVRTEDLGGGLERVVYRDTVPLGDEDRRFMRLDVGLEEQ